MKDLSDMTYAEAKLVSAAAVLANEHLDTEDKVSLLEGFLRKEIEELKAHYRKGGNDA